MVYNSSLHVLSVLGDVYGKEDRFSYFAVIAYDDSDAEFVFSARRWKLYANDVTSYVCQMQQQGPFSYYYYHF